MGVAKRQTERIQRTEAANYLISGRIGEDTVVRIIDPLGR
jgi:hypothetical protein